MTYSPFCASPSCLLHCYQCDDSVEALRIPNRHDAHDLQFLTYSFLGDSAATRVVHRVWRPLADGTRIAVCSDCEELGRAGGGDDPIYKRVRRAIPRVWDTKEARPKFGAMGRREFAERLDGAPGCYFAIHGRDWETRFDGLEIVRLDSPSGLFVF